jgi:hypothetical protein
LTGDPIFLLVDFFTILLSPRLDLGEAIFTLDLVGFLVTRVALISALLGRELLIEAGVAPGLTFLTTFLTGDFVRTRTGAASTSTIDKERVAIDINIVP